jgi:RHS repeat-associated protein
MMPVRNNLKKRKFSTNNWMTRLEECGEYRVGQLVGAQVPVPVTQTGYNLDAVGNWNSKTTDGTTGAELDETPRGNGRQTRSHTEANEITQIVVSNQSSVVSYDHTGNLTGDGQYTHEYDEHNRLIRVTRILDSAVVGEYVYDALGRRVAKLADGDGDGNRDETRFYFDGARAIEDQTAGGVTLATYVLGRYMDEVLTMDRSGSRSFYHQNTLWSPHGLTDTAGNVVERYFYDAYGKVTITDGLYVAVPLNSWGTPHSGIGNRVLFTGREFDEETGLYFYRARYYDAAKGRFLQRDPLGYVDGMNLYEYVRSRSVNRVDPLGLVSAAEKAWCLANKACCCVAWPSAKAIEDMITKRYGKDPQKDSVGNAVKHCSWMCLVAYFKACGAAVAVQLGVAHESTSFGDPHGRAMDLHNNSIGAYLGGNGPDDCVLKCEQKANSYSLYWFELDPKLKGPSLPKNYPGFGIDPNGNLVFGGYGQQSNSQPVLWPEPDLGWLK